MKTPTQSRRQQVSGGDEGDRTLDLRIANAALSFARNSLMLRLPRRREYCGAPSLAPIYTKFGYTSWVRLAASCSLRMRFGLHTVNRDGKHLAEVLA